MVEVQHLRPPAWATSAWDYVATSGQAKVFPGKSPAKPEALGKCFSFGFVWYKETYGTAAPHIRRAALGHSCRQWHGWVTKSDCDPNCLPGVEKSPGFARLLPQVPDSLGKVSGADPLL